MKHILLLEDDQALGRGIAMALETPDCAVICSGTLGQAAEHLADQRFELLILDINLPDGSGLDLLRQVRAGGDATPVILLTANDLELEEVTGLEAGADDYITKPFSMRELLARVKANIRRSGMIPAVQPASGSGERLELGRISIDTELLVAYKDGKGLDLTQREYELLKFLGSQPGKVFSREALMEHVWNYEGYVGDVRAVDVAVRRLREKVEDDPAAPQFIVTRRGMGYLFNL